MRQGASQQAIGDVDRLQPTAIGRMRGKSINRTACGVGKHSIAARNVYRNEREAELGSLVWENLRLGEEQQRWTSVLQTPDL